MLYLQKQLGIKLYRTAWLMGHKIRQAMIQRNSLYMLEGIVEADEFLLAASNLWMNCVKQAATRPRF